MTNGGKVFSDGAAELARVRRWQAIEAAAVHWSTLLLRAETGQVSSTQVQRAADALRRAVGHQPQAGKR